MIVTMRLTHTMLACALVACTSLAQAQAAASPAKKELVQRALQLQQAAIENVGNALAGQTANQVLQVVGQAMARIPADKREDLGAELQADVRKFYDEISPTLRERAGALAPATIGQTMEAKFSEEELKVLVAWLDSPVNRKFQAAAGEMLQNLGQSLVADTRPMIEPKLKALELAVQAKLNAASGTKSPAAAAKPAVPKK